MSQFAARILSAVRQSDLDGFAADACTALQVLSNRFEIQSADSESITVKMQGLNMDWRDFRDFTDDLKYIDGVVNINRDGTWKIYKG